MPFRAVVGFEDEKHEGVPMVGCGYHRRMFVGVDGCPKGWVSVSLDEAGYTGAGLFADFAELVAAHRSARVIAVDIPIGLVDGPGRAADQAARVFLKGNASSVFNSPVRSALAAPSYEEAKAISVEVSGKGLSKQSYALFEKIREVDAWAGDERVFEVHPEVSFRVMNGGDRIPHSKKTWGGLAARLEMLRAQGIELPGSLGDADAVGTDDVVDAAAAAWSARRIVAGVARSFPPAMEQRDRSGRGIAIWA